MRSICLGLFGLLLAGCQENKNDPPAGRGPVVPASPSTPPAQKSKAGPVAEVSGMIKGSPFKPDSVTLQGNTLSFRKGKGVFSDMEITFQVPAKAEDIREGNTWNLGGDQFGHPFLNVSAKDGSGFAGSEAVRGEDYSMTLTITKRTPKAIEGTINLKVMKPENTNLAGKFSATVKKTGTDPLDADDAPYIQGKIIMKGDWKEESLTAGFQAKGADGKSYSNLSGTAFSRDGGGSASSLTFDPQITSVLSDKKDGPRFVHTRLAPGEYLVYVRRGGVLAAWKNVTVKPGDQQKVDLTIDLDNVGSLVVTLLDKEVIGKDDTNFNNLQLIPDGISLPTDFNAFLFDAGQVKEGEKTITSTNVPAGKYKAIFRKSEVMVEVVAGKESAVTLVPKKK